MILKSRNRIAIVKNLDMGGKASFTLRDSHRLLFVSVLLINSSFFFTTRQFRSMNMVMMVHVLTSSIILCMMVISVVTSSGIWVFTQVLWMRIIYEFISALLYSILCENKKKTPLGCLILSSFQKF